MHIQRRWNKLESQKIKFPIRDLQMIIFIDYIGKNQSELCFLKNDCQLFLGKHMTMGWGFT